MSDYGKLVKALRCCADPDMPCYDCPRNDGVCAERLFMDAAAAIEELQAEVEKYHDAFGRLSKTAVELEQRVVELRELPKRGEWVSEWDGYEFDVRCSVCGEMALIKEGGSHDHAYSRFCPNCGAKMEVQDGKD